MVTDKSYKEAKVLHEYLFLDTEMGEGEVKNVYSAKCYGPEDNCDLFSFPGHGYTIVMLKKENMIFYFKHVVFDSTFSSYDYVDSTQLKKVNV